MNSGFFVYIVESPSATDFYHNRTEGALLGQALGLCGIRCVGRCAITSEAFRAALQIGLGQEMANFNGLVPVLHISSHGHQDGIALSSGEMVSWHQLGALLVPINKAFGNRLVVAMSCCSGYSGTRMAMKIDDSPLPYFALVGSGASPQWSETSIAFAVFYHRMSKGAHVREAVEAMNIAVGRNDFHLQWAEESKKAYMDYIKNFNSQSAQQQLQRNADTTSPNERAKYLAPTGVRSTGKAQGMKPTFE